MVAEVVSQQAAAVVAEPVKSPAVAMPEKHAMVEPVKPTKRASPEVAEEDAPPAKKMRVHGPVGRFLGSIAQWFADKLSDGVSVAGKQSCPTVSDEACDDDDDEDDEVA
eukprot:TRINITY_DN784_c0_g1_i1.p1 TRINITY_DN784_c0_g1~~TRINITY_DN784_c0_g1_i1.p1  ORF type:complete len:109 (-),score=29.11 TRINITY_DN784_c0_g1_i1:118-444(-)